MEKIGTGGIGFTVKQALELQIDRIRPFEGQPRKHFDPESLRLLSESIKSTGQIDPVAVMRIFNDKDHDYELVDGERRYRAAKLAGKETVLAVEVEIKNIPGVKPKDLQYIISALSNFGHEDHEPLEVANALARTQDALGASQAELGRMFGHSTPWVQNHLNLLKLCPTVHKLMAPAVDEDKRLRPASALLLIGLPEQTQADQALKAVENRWTKNQLAQSIRGLMREEGVVKEGTRKRAASDDFALIESAVNNIDTRLMSINDVPFSTISNVIRTRGPQAKAALYTILKRNAEILSQLADKVNRIDMEGGKGIQVIKR